MRATLQMSSCFTAAMDENEELMKEIKESSHKVHIELKSALVTKHLDAGAYS